MLDHRLKEAFIDKNGNKYYEFVRPMDMTQKRFQSARVQEHFLRMGLTETFLRNVCKGARDICWDQNRTLADIRRDMDAIFANIQQRLGYVCGEDNYLRLAAVYFLIEDEPVDECVEAFTMKKIALWEANKDAKDFFLLKAFSSIMESGQLLLEEIQSYLAMAAIREANLPTLPTV